MTGGAGGSTPTDVADLSSSATLELDLPLSALTTTGTTADMSILPISGTTNVEYGTWSEVPHAYLA